MARHTRCLAAGVLFLTLRASAADGWETYVNPRFSFMVDYPANLLKAQPGPTNGDGLEFRSRNSKASFTASGMWLNDASVRESAGLAEDRCVDHHAGYKLLKPRLWVVSCPIPGGGVLYAKGVRGKEAEATLYAIYPDAERGTWDAVVARMAQSLSAPHPDD